MKKAARTIVYKDESRLFYGAVLILFSVFFMYVYFVSASISDVVMRKEIDSQIATLTASISQMEAEYIELQHSVSNDIATHKGYVAVTSKIFIDKSEDTTLVLRNE